MAVRLGRVVVLVHHYDEAMAFYTEQFGCEVVLDRPGPDGLRYLTVHQRRQALTLITAPDRVTLPGDPAAR